MGQPQGLFRIGADVICGRYGGQYDRDPSEGHGQGVIKLLKAQCANNTDGKQPASAVTTR